MKELFCYFRKRKYPQTGDGRKRYIQDSLIRTKKVYSGLLFIALAGIILIIILVAILCAA